MRVADILEFLDSPISIGFDLPPEQALAFMRSRGLRETFSYADLVGEERTAAFTVAKMLDTDLLATVHESLIDAAARGVSYQDWAKSIIPTLQERGWWGRQEVVDPVTGERRMATLGTPARLQTIFRTNMQTAYAVGEWQQIIAQAEDAPYLLYDAVDDHRTRPLHAAWDNVVLPVVHPWWRSHMPPNGWTCFPPEQVVSGCFEVGLKAWYSGPMVQLATREGRALTVTANHPVLTDNGWVAAGLLSEGDRILAYCGEVERVALRGVNHQQGPSPAEDVFEALAANGMPRAVVPSRSALDLYGDMRFSDGYIDVVGTDRVLRLGAVAATHQRGQDGHLAVPDAFAQTQVAGSGSACAFSEASLPPTAGIPCAAQLALDGGAVGAGPFDPLLLGGGSKRDASRQQEPAERGSAEADILRDAEKAFAGTVTFDNIVAVRRFDWSGHVYDFQTDSGFIVAGGIVTSNCRCSVIQLSKSDLDDLGLQVTVTPPAGTYDWKNPRTGRVEKVPTGIDPGFDHNPGQRRLEELQRLAGEKVKALPPDARKAAAEGLVATQRALALQFDPTTPAGEWHSRSWSGAQDWLLPVLVREQAVAVTRQSGGAYAMLGQSINMPASYTVRSLENLTTWRHEFGHILDVRIGSRAPGAARTHVSAGEAFTAAMRADARDLAKAAHADGPAAAPKRQALVESYRALQGRMIDMTPDARLLYLRDRAAALGISYDDLRAEMKANSAALFDTLAGDARVARMLEAIERRDVERFVAEAAGMDTPGQLAGASPEDRRAHFLAVRESWKRGTLGFLSDLAGAATRNRIAGINAGFPGHTEAYYRKRPGYGQQTEAFANLAAFAGAPHPLWWELVRRFFPKMAAEFERIIRNAQ